MIRRPPRSPLIPYTPLFRSADAKHAANITRLLTPYNARGHRLAGDLSGGGAYILFCMGKPGVNPISDPSDRKSTRLNSSHANISYAVFRLKKNHYTMPYAVV